MAFSLPKGVGWYQLLGMRVGEVFMLFVRCGQ